MPTVAEHYDEVLSDVYSWMLGGFGPAIRGNTEFFDSHGLHPKGSRVAIDLGAGCGFQSIPLARAGYSVTAIDSDTRLLHELKANCRDLTIRTVRDNLVNFDRILPGQAELIVCMTDTILHLESGEEVRTVFEKISQALESDGKLVLTFRDLTHELQGLDRFLPVRSDETTIMTCFLEYEAETVKVHDIIYKSTGGRWELRKSFYRKLRLSESWVCEQLSSCGLNRIESSSENGLVTIIASEE